MSEIRIGVIGGSGLYDMAGLDVVEERRLETPFGDPSDAFLIGRMDGQSIAFLPRHGRGHRLLPSELNYRANIFGMKMLGVEQIVSVSAVGSMKLEYPPGDVVVPDQFFDRTRHRADTFFGDGLVAHVSLADPVCADLSAQLVACAGECGARVHAGGTYLCMEGPQFSTRAESEIYRGWGVDVIGMTNLQEAKLAREAEICYASLSMVTDYDCWHEAEEAVTVDAVLTVLRANASLAQSILARWLRSKGEDQLAERQCPCGSALASALITDPAAVPRATLHKLAPIVGKYFAD